LRKRLGASTLLASGAARLTWLKPINDASGKQPIIKLILCLPIP
jgi:hypothetical protein